MFLADCDKRIPAHIDQALGEKIFRQYVDDYLVVLREVQPHVRDKYVQGILNVLGTGSKGLKFTHELPKKSSIKFLKVRFKMSEKHVC